MFGFYREMGFEQDETARRRCGRRMTSIRREVSLIRRDGTSILLSSALLEGLSLSETATRFQISVNTVRWHLKRLFEKTSTKRQGDLIRLASSAIPQIRVGRDDRMRGSLN